MDNFIRHYESFASQKGWSIPKQHEFIIDEIFKLHDHFAEHDLAARAKLKGCSTKILHQVLARLVESGMIRKLYFNQGRIYFEHVYGHMHHDHLVCLHCGKIKEFSDDVIEKQQKRISLDHGFEMVKHSLHILGVCRDCQQKIQSNELPYGLEDVSVKKNDIVPLTVIPGGRKAKVIRLEGSQTVQRRLREMGIVSGGTIQVVSNQFAGPFVVKIKSTRLAIGHNLAHNILVSDYQ